MALLPVPSVTPNYSNHPILADVNSCSRSLCYRRSVCLSVVCRLSVMLVHPTQPVEIFGNFFSPYDSPGTLLFWYQKWLVETPLSP